MFYLCCMYTDIHVCTLKMYMVLQLSPFYFTFAALSFMCVLKTSSATVTLQAGLLLLRRKLTLHFSVSRKLCIFENSISEVQKFN